MVYFPSAIGKVRRCIQPFCLNSFRIRNMTDFSIFRSKRSTQIKKLFILLGSQDYV